MLTIYDEHAQEITLEQLRLRFGDVRVYPRPDPDSPGWEVVIIQIHAEPQNLYVPHRAGRLWAHGRAPTPDVPAAIGVNLTRAGKPVIGKKVAWYWPDAPVDPLAGGWGRADQNETNTNNMGSVDLCMGPGAYYFPPGGGPHAVWVYGNSTNSELVSGLGMLGNTNHDHLDLFYEWTEPGDEDIKAQLDRIETLLLHVHRHFPPDVHGDDTEPE